MLDKLKTADHELTLAHIVRDIAPLILVAVAFEG